MGFFSRERNTETPLFADEDGTESLPQEQPRGKLRRDERTGILYMQEKGYTRNVTQEELEELHRQETWGPLFG